MGRLLGRLFGTTLATMNVIASLWVMFLVALISADVIGRSVFNLPIPGVPEIVKFSIVAMVWLQMAYALRAEKHLRTTLVLGMLPRLGQRIVLTLNSIAGIFIFSFVTWLGWIELGKTWEIGAFEGEHPVRIPIWPLWGILVVGSAFTAIQFALDAVRYVRYGARPSELSETPDLPPETV